MSFSKNTNTKIEEKKIKFKQQNSTPLKHVFPKRRNSKLISKSLKERIKQTFEIPTIENLYNLVNKKKRDLNDNEKIIQFLNNLEPFNSRLNLCLENNKEECIRRFIYDFKNEIYEKNKIIYKYGDEANNFFIIEEGKVDLIFPYYEYVELNIDEYYIYLLKLRRFNEIEILNEIILLNNKIYLEDIDKNFSFDDWIKTAFNTLIQMELLSEIIKDENWKSEIINMKFNKNENDILFNEKIKTFDNIEIKESLLRIKNELNLTIKYCFPEIYKEVKKDNSFLKRKIIDKSDFDNSNLIKKLENVTTKEYIERIKITKITNSNLENKQIKIINYLHINTLNSGEHFGDIQQDYMHIFTYEEIEKTKKNSVNFNLHQFDLFRNMSVISKERCVLGYISKKTYFTSLKRFSDKFNSFKSNFLLENQLFKGINNENLLKTFSLCFKEKNIKQGEKLINQGKIFDENNIKIYFIQKGEFQTKCIKSIEQIDQILKLIGFEKEINQTFPKELNGIIDTHYYNQIIKKVISLKLNFVSQNEIVGLFDIFLNNYFNDVICNSINGKVLEVNLCIVKLLINYDSQVKKNKNRIMNNKINLLKNILLTQRKVFFSCFFEKEKLNIFEKKKIEDEKNNNTNNHNNNFKQRKLIISPVKLIKKINESFETPKINKKDNLYTSLGDLDIMLGKIKSKFTLLDYREQRKKEFRKKYLEMQILNKQLIKSKSTNNYFSPKFERKLYLSKSLKKLLPRLKIKDNINDSNNINLEYNLKKSNSEKNINPLIYDNFMRTYNTSQYFSNLFNKKRNNSQYEGFKFNIKLSPTNGTINLNSFKSTQKNYLLTQKLRRIYSRKINKILKRLEDK